MLKFKRTSIILMILLLLVSMCCNAEEIQPPLKSYQSDVENLYVFDDFENREPGTGGTNIPVRPAAGEYAVDAFMADKGSGLTTVVEEDENKFIRLTSPQGVYAVNNRAIDTDRLSVSFDCRFGDNTDPTQKNQEYFLFYTGNVTVFELRYINGSVFFRMKTGTTYNDSEYTQITSMTNVTGWNNLVFNFRRELDEGSYKVILDSAYINDKRVGMFDGFTNNFISSNFKWWESTTKIRFVNGISATNNPNSLFDIDNILVYSPKNFAVDYCNVSPESIVLKFTAAIDSSLLDSINVTNNAIVLACTKELDSDGRIVTITPAQPLDIENKVYIVNATGITSVAGDSLDDYSKIISNKAIEIEEIKLVGDSISFNIKNKKEDVEFIAVVCAWNDNIYLGLRTSEEALLNGETKTCVINTGFSMQPTKYDIFMLDDIDSLTLLSEVHKY